MIKWVKRIIKLFVGLAFLLGLATVGVIMFVDPNQFKEKIEDLVLVETTQVFKINGPLTWHWYPTLSLAINDIVLQNDTTFKGSLLSAKKAELECSLWSALSGKILLNLNLQDFNINLQKNASGMNNWEHLIKTTTVPKDKKAHAPLDANAHAKPRVSVMINALNIQNGTISFKDVQNKTSYTLEHLQLQAQNLCESVIGLSNPLVISFALTDNTQNTMTVSTKSDWSFNAEANTIRLKHLTLSLKHGTQNPLVLTANVKINLTPSLNITGDAASEKLELGKLKLTHLQTQFKLTNNILDLSPITFQMANAVQNMHAQLNFQNKVPQYHLNHSAKNIDLATLSNALMPERKIEGALNVTLDLSSQGSTQNTILKNLSGTTAMDIQDGKIYGIDLIALLKNAEKTVHDLLSALISQQSISSDTALNTAQEQWQKVDKNACTPFNTLNFQANIRQGTALSALTISHPEYSVNGSGSVQLPEQSIQYKTSILLKSHQYPVSDEIGNYLANVPIPVLIQGGLADPKIRPDMNTYFNSGFQYAQKNLVKKMVDSAVQKTFSQFLKTGQ
jgi:uncharacterized protein involved in outer membrane biogenesis